MNKSLLASSIEGGNSEFLVSVDVLGTRMLGYTRTWETSSIQPNTIDVNGFLCSIEGLFTYSSPSITNPETQTVLYIDLDGDSVETDLYIGRNDTRQYLGTVFANGEPADFALFTSADVGKTIPIYLSATTPPLCVSHATLSHSRWRHEDTIRDARAKQLSDFNCRVFRKCASTYRLPFQLTRPKYRNSSIKCRKYNSEENRSYYWSTALYKSDQEGNFRCGTGRLQDRKFNWSNFYKYSRYNDTRYRSRVLYDRAKCIIHLRLQLAINCDLFKEVA